MLNRAYQAGMSVVFIEDTGGAVLTSATITSLMQVNLLARAWCETHPGSIWVPACSLVWSNTATSKIAFKAGYGYETNVLHYGPQACFAIGQYIADALRPLIPRRDERKYSTFETFAQNGKDMIPNPLFAAATGGSAGTGITANSGVPSGVTIARTGSATATVTVAAEPNGRGNTVQLACSWTAAGEFITVEFDLGQTNLYPGDQVYSQAHIDVAAGSTNMAIPWLLNRIWVNGTNIETCDMLNTQQVAAGPTTAYSLDLKTDDNGSLPTDTISGGTNKWRLVMGAVGAGSGTVTVSLPGFTKR